MDTNSMFGMMDGLIILCGLYVIYQAVSMYRSGDITGNPLLPKNLNAAACRDKNGFIAAMWKKQLLCGVLAVLSGCAGVLEDYTGMVGPYVYLGMIVLLVGFLIWYSVMVKKTVKLFW